MCYAYGSLDQAVNVCPMCKVFKPSGRCPHVRDVCRNRVNHPRLDVVYLKNAEVNCFNGCGFCKWANTNPPAKSAGYQNPGWPGCCRPPAAGENRFIKAADWPSVSQIHHVPIPTEIKSILDSVSSRGSPIPALSTNAVRSLGGQSATPSLDRRNSGSGSPSSKSINLSGKATVMAVPGKTRPGGSPPQTTSSLASANALSSSVPTSSSMDQVQRRQIASESSERRIEGPNSSHSSPSRKNVDLDQSITPRRKSNGRPSIDATTPSISVTKLNVNAQPQTPQFQSSIRRRGSVSSTTSSSTPPTKSSPTSRPVDRPISSGAPRATLKKAPDNMSSASSSSGSDGPGSMTDSTVTSDGGFTDYLSDESEAELQRQAEAKAALVAQNQMEELEFKAARQRLAHVDLRPPKSWNPSKDDAVRLTGTVAHTPSYSPGAPFNSTPFASAMAHTGSQARD